SDGTKALDATGTFALHGGGFANVTADEVHVQYNSTGVDYSTTNRTLTVNDLSGTLTAPLGTAAAPFVGVNVTGLHADLAGFVRIDGNFSFEKGTTQGGTSIIKVGVSSFHVALGDG